MPVLNYNVKYFNYIKENFLNVKRQVLERYVELFISIDKTSLRSFLRNFNRIKHQVDIMFLLFSSPYCTNIRAYGNQIFKHLGKIFYYLKVVYFQCIVSIIRGYYSI